MKCIVCQTDITNEEVSQYAAYGGLPSPCCNICFSVNDYSIKSIEELQAKSLLKRFENSGTPESSTIKKFGCDVCGEGDDLPNYKCANDNCPY